MTRNRLVRTVGSAAAAALLVGAGSVGGIGSSAVASDSTCAPAYELPTLNTWYDGNNKYQGTRLVHQDPGYYYHDVVYDTYGPNYRQVEMWSVKDPMMPYRVACERKPAEPEPEPETPVITGGGGVGTGFHVSFPSLGVGFSVSGDTGRKGKVTVGEVEQVE